MVIEPSKAASALAKEIENYLRAQFDSFYRETGFIVKEVIVKHDRDSANRLGFDIDLRVGVE